MITTATHADDINQQVCYYYNGDPRTIYERLGHAEVVQVALSGSQTDAEREFKCGSELGGR